MGANLAHPPTHGTRKADFDTDTDQCFNSFTTDELEEDDWKNTLFDFSKMQRQATRTDENEVNLLDQQLVMQSGYYELPLVPQTRILTTPLNNTSRM